MKNARSLGFSHLSSVVALSMVSLAAMTGCGDDTAGEGGSASTEDTSATGSAAAGGGHCPGTVVAHWTDKGATHQSSTTVFLSQETTFNVTIVGCDESESTVTLALIPYPPTTGTYELTGSLDFMHEKNAPAAQLAENKAGYNTYDTHVGTLSLTVDATAHTMSGTFSFEAAKMDDPSTVIEVTDGSLDGVQWK